MVYIKMLVMLGWFKAEMGKRQLLYKSVFDPTILSTVGILVLKHGEIFDLI